VLWGRFRPHAHRRVKTAEIGRCREPIGLRCGIRGSVWRYEQDKQRKGNDINRSHYAGGYALYAYDLTPDLAVNDHVNVSGINRSIELEILRGTGALDHRRRLCRVREQGQNQPKSQHRSRFHFQQLMNMTDIDRLSCSDGACRQMFRGVLSVDTLPDRPRQLVCDTEQENAGWPSS
jgi:hypothetical protein